MKSFPFKLNGFITSQKFEAYLTANKIRFVGILRANEYLNGNMYNTFDQIYGNILQAMSEYDFDYLNQIMEKKLYDSTYNSLNEIKERNYKLNYVCQTEQNINNSINDKNDDDDESDDESLNFIRQRKSSIFGEGITRSVDNIIQNMWDDYFISSAYTQKDMQIQIQAEGVFGVDIDRHKNIGNYKILENYYGAKKFFIDPNNLRSLYDKQILILNVFYYTSRKLVLYNENMEIIGGSQNPKKFFDHKFRFESYNDKIDWILTDIDDHLRGNPYTNKDVSLKRTRFHK